MPGAANGLKKQPTQPRINGKYAAFGTSGTPAPGGSAPTPRTPGSASRGAPIPTPPTDSVPPSTPKNTPFDSDGLTAGVKIVTDYQSRRISRENANTSLASLFPDSQVQAHWSSVLDQTDAERAATAQTAQPPTNPGRSASSRPTRSASCPPGPAPDPSTAPLRSALPDPALAQQLPTKPPSDMGEAGPDDESLPDDIQDGDLGDDIDGIDDFISDALNDNGKRSLVPFEPPSKRRLDVSKLPWGNTSPFTTAQLHPTLRKTLHAKENFLRDVPLVKASLLAQPNLPPLSTNLWDFIIRSAYVDLDKVFDSNFSVQPVEHEAEIAGSGIRIVLPGGSSSSSTRRTIRSSGEWTVAWHKYKRAVLYVYPHRSEELDTYEAYVIGLFGSYRQTLHPNIILLDRAIRHLAAECNSVLLSDPIRFSNLEKMHLDANGANSQLPGLNGREQRHPGRPSPGPSGSSGRSREICRRWNGGTNCDASRCNYRHQCSKCRGTHRARDCSEAAKAGAGDGKSS